MTVNCKFCIADTIFYAATTGSARSSSLRALLLHYAAQRGTSAAHRAAPGPASAVED